MLPRFAAPRWLVGPVLASTLLTLTAAVPAAAAALRGTVTDPGGRPVPSARVLVSGPLGVRLVVTDASGGFEIADLAPATYRVTVDVQGFAVDPVELGLAGDDTRQLTLRLSIAPVAESVVVSASQVERPLSDLSPSVSVVGATELASRQVSSVAEALQLLPGFGVTTTGGAGALASLFPRGGESDYTLVMVNGLRVNAFGGGVDLSQVALAGVERIEVVRGPQSALHGADAIGGVVQIVTRHGGPTRVDALAEAGAQATRRFAAGGSGALGLFGWSGSAERSDSDGYEGVAPASGEIVSNDDGWRRQFAGAASWQFSPTASVRADARALDSERGYPGPYGSNPIGAFAGVDAVSRGSNRHRQAGVSAVHEWGSGTRAAARQRYTASWSDLDSDFRSPFGPSAFETRRISARTQTDLAFGPATALSAGLEAWTERARSTYITGEAFQEIPVERRLIGVFGEWRQTVARDLSIVAGVRVEHIRRAALEADPNVFAPRPAFGASVHRSVEPRVSLNWAVARDRSGSAVTRVHAAAGTGMRPPDAFEIAFTDNPALEPERSRSVEAGVTQDLDRIGAQVTVTGFRNDYDDLIVAVGRSMTDASRYRTDNISNARAQGVELSVAWRAPWGLAARAGYTWLDTEILAVDRAGVAPPPFSAGDALIRRPRHQASGILTFTLDRLVAFAEIGARGRTLDIEPNYGAFGGVFENRGFTVADAGVSFQVARGVEAIARVSNLFDRAYEEAYGFPAPGRLAMVGVRFAHGR